MVFLHNDRLLELNLLTERIYQSLQELDDNMDKNEPEKIEQFLQLFIHRGEVIESIKSLFESGQIFFNDNQHKLVTEIKEREEKIQPRMNVLFDSFTGQITKLQHGKKVTQHYNTGFTDFYTDGAYIDKRK